MSVCLMTKMPNVDVSLSPTCRVRVGEHAQQGYEGGNVPCRFREGKHDMFIKLNMPILRIRFNFPSFSLVPIICIAKHSLSLFGGVLAQHCLVPKNPHSLSW